MPERREIIATETSAAILASIGIFPASAKLSPKAPAIDRELCLSISDGFTRQSWRSAGRVWTETRDTLSMQEDECVRITVFNDMPGLRVVSLGDGRMLRVPSGEIMSMVVTIDGPFLISVVGQPAMSRPVHVRAPEAAPAGAG